MEKVKERLSAKTPREKEMKLCNNCRHFGKEGGYCMITGDDTLETDTCTGWDLRIQEDDE